LTENDEITDRVASWLKTDGACDWPEWLLHHQLEIPVARRQILIHHDNSGGIAGLMLWAFVGDDVHRKLSHGKSVILHISEWSEGLNPWLWIISPQRILPPAFRRQLRILVSGSGRFNLYAPGSTGLLHATTEWCNGVRFRSSRDRAKVDPTTSS